MLWAKGPANFNYANSVSSLSKLFESLSYHASEFRFNLVNKFSTSELTCFRHIWLYPVIYVHIYSPAGDKEVGGIGTLLGLH